MNLHTPERQAHETQTEYRARRAQAREAVRLMTKGPRQTPAINKLDFSRFFLGQHTNPARAERRAVIAKHGIRQFKRMAREMGVRNARRHPA